MATPTKVLTYDGLLYYTLLLRVKLADKLEASDLTSLSNSIPSTITITNSASNATFALTSTSGTGTATTLPAVDSTNAGLMTPTMLSKLNGIASGAEVNTIENIKIEGESSNVSISSKVATIPLVTTSNSGAMSNTDKTKLNGVATGAQVNVIESIKLQGASSDLSISSKKVTIPVDTTPANGSGNPISSGAVYTLQNSITDSITQLEGKIISLNYVSNTTPTSPSYGEFWYDTANDVLKEYKQATVIGSNDSWVPYISSSNSIVIGTFTDIRTDETKGYIFTYNGNVIKIADSTDITEKLALKAPLASPALTGTPTAPTASTGTSTTQLATTAFVQQELSAAVLGRFKFVNSLPVTGESGYIYLVPHQHTLTGTTTNGTYTPDTTSDIKDEYIWDATNSRYELIGHTDIDLSNYWNKTDLVELTTTEITTIWNTGMSDSNS